MSEQYTSFYRDYLTLVNNIAFTKKYSGELTIKFYEAVYIIFIHIYKKC